MAVMVKFWVNCYKVCHSRPGFLLTTLYLTTMGLGKCPHQIRTGC